MNKITLDKTKAYDISELNREEMEQIAEATGDCGTDYLIKNKHLELYYDECGEEWFLDMFKEYHNIPESENLINAKTLFK